ncbi:hypothetical protein ARMSODRAFT_982653 [Armillaria solidipes]|uniref:Uncharacterized protein n=1 Tax=Armillaria solidipes TaxID=1076256 RepID=A0A2H3B1V0_9AGAR|nr:hypothetical protein ARMSODRAFT_982653 [Armillaria solidipes]
MISLKSRSEETGRTAGYKRRAWWREPSRVSHALSSFALTSISARHLDVPVFKLHPKDYANVRGGNDVTSNTGTVIKSNRFPLSVLPAPSYLPVLGDACIGFALPTTSPSPYILWKEGVYPCKYLSSIMCARSLVDPDQSPSKASPINLLIGWKILVQNPGLSNELKSQEFDSFDLLEFQPKRGIMRLDHKADKIQLR